MKTNNRFLLLLFVLVSVTFSKSSWGQFAGFPSPVTITYEGGTTSDATFIVNTANQAKPPHIFPLYPAPSTYTFSALSSPFLSFDISAYYTRTTPPYNTTYYNYWISIADVDAASGSAFYYSNGAQLTITRTGLNQYSFRIDRPVGLP